MKQKYQFNVLLLYDEANRLQNVWLPDFGGHYLVKTAYELPLFSGNNNLQIKVAIVELIDDLVKNKGFHFVRPVSFLDACKSTHGVESHDIWTTIVVELDLPKGYLAAALPKIGSLSNCISLITGGVLELIGMQYVNNNEKTSEFVYLLPIIGTTLEVILSIIIYEFSGTSDMLVDKGRVIDNAIAKYWKCQRSEPLPSEEAPLMQPDINSPLQIVNHREGLFFQRMNRARLVGCKKNVLWYGLNIFLLGAAVIHEAILGFNDYRSDLFMIKQVHKEDRHIPLVLMQSAFWISFITSRISGFAFTLNFVYKSLQYFHNYLSKDNTQEERFNSSFNAR